MKHLVALFLAAVVFLGSGFALAADPTPKGFEQSIVFVNNTTAVKVRVAQRKIDGGWAPASFMKIASDDSIRVRIVEPEADGMFYGPGEWVDDGDIDYEVNRMLRYTPGNPALDLSGPIQEVWLYGPAGGATVSVNMWVEY